MPVPGSEGIVHKWKPTPPIKRKEFSPQVRENPEFRELHDRTFGNPLQIVCADIIPELDDKDVLLSMGWIDGY